MAFFPCLLLYLIITVLRINGQTVCGRRTTTTENYLFSMQKFHSSFFSRLSESPKHHVHKHHCHDYLRPRQYPIAHVLPALPERNRKKKVPPFSQDLGDTCVFLFCLTKRALSGLCNERAPICIALTWRRNGERRLQVRPYNTIYSPSLAQQHIHPFPFQADLRLGTLL